MGADGAGADGAVGGAAVDPHDPQPQLPLFEREVYIASAADTAPTDDSAAFDHASDDATAGAADEVSVRLLPVILNTDCTKLEGVLTLVGERKVDTGAANALASPVSCVRVCTRGALA